MSRNRSTFVHVKLDTIRKRASRKNLKFEMNFSVLQKMLSNPICKKCGVFCNVEVVSGCEEDDFFSVDRINPLVGYVPSNVQVLCRKCNNKKSVRDEVIHYRNRQLRNRMRF